WVTSMVEGAATVVSYLERRPSTAREGTTRIYGPYEDNDGRDLSWLVRLDGNLAGSQFELWVGSREAQSQDEMHKLLAGDLHIDGDKRSGGFMLDFDVVELYPQMKGSYAADLYTYAGVVDVNFERDVSTEAKTITIDFQDVEVLYDGFLDSDKFNSDDTYVYERRDDGSGVYHLALFGEWDEWAWSGAEQEEMVLDMAWTPEGAGRARGQMLEANGVGDLKYGDLLVHECFDGDGYLTWRWVTEAYLAEDPDYNLGDEATCTLTEADLINP
ncbi:MAG: hypothetical protein KC636_39415, partial [Myxococcales bacterium]|nr:hypothetical protein [Myxococcales bacterium]